MAQRDQTMSMLLESPAFSPNGTIPEEYTCDGENLSPCLSWSGAPEGTRSFLLVCIDPDAPSGVFHHWAAYDIPASCHRLEKGAAQKGPRPGLKEALNDFGDTGYGGPCPPHKDRPHHYHFRLSALSVDALPVRSRSTTCREVIALAKPYELETVELVGLYGRS
jgi:Raf kinase inhibitor-like YbhB/YbcL family protein